MGVWLLGFVIRPRQLRAGWLLLYAGTFAVQLFCASARSALAYPLLWVAFKVAGQPTGIVHLLAFLLGYVPLGISVLTLLLPAGGWWWQQRTGGRAPSARERLLLEDALESLQAVDPSVKQPGRWFVLDDGAINAAVYAETLMLTRGLLESPWLTAVLAHELAHLHGSDGRVTAAIYRLTTPPRGQLRWPWPGRWLIRAILFLGTGELGLWVMRGPWGIYWRSREHAADRYAATLGQGEALAEFLDINALPWDLPVPFRWLSEESHPPSEHRIDRLYHHQQAENA